LKEYGYLLQKKSKWCEYIQKKSFDFIYHFIDVLMKDDKFKDGEVLRELSIFLKLMCDSIVVALKHTGIVLGMENF